MFGMFLPTAVFAILFRVVVYPLIPAESEILETLEGLDTEWEIVAVSLLAVLLSALLFVVNGPIIRMYEGYPWKDGPLGEALIRREQARFERARAQRMALPQLGHETRTIDNGSLGDRATGIFALWDRTGATYNREFPDEPALVLPTRLGNAIRSFETYSWRRYGMEAINLWPRLIAKIDERFAGAIDEAKTLFDFMLNASLLSALFGLTMGIAGALRPDDVGTQAIWRVQGPFVWLGGILAAFGLSYLCYHRAIREAIGWGDMVTSAFDLYRGDLLKSLGHQTTPTTIAEEKALWQGISFWVQRDDSPFASDQRYGPASPPAVYAEPASPPEQAATLQLHRGVGDPRVDGTVLVHLRVTKDGSQPAARSVTVVDSIPDGFDYLWDSARATSSSGARTVSVNGANPITFDLGDLPRGAADVTVTYRIVKRA